MCAALAAAAALVRIYTFPFGGSVTLCSMLFIMLPAWFYGVKEGILTGLVFGILQFVIEPYFLSFPQVLLDYVLAFSIMGIAGFFRSRKNGLITGYLAAVAARWAVAVCAGLAWFYAGMSAWEGWSPLPYSMVYNAIYIFTEAALTLILLAVPAVRKALERIRKNT